MLIYRTATICPHADNIAEIQGTVEIDDDYLSALENIPTAPDNNIVTWGTWAHNNICNRRLAGASKTRPTINFPSLFLSTFVDLFDLLFPKQFVIDVILVKTNKELKVMLLYGEFQQWIGVWSILVTIQGLEQHDFWKLSEIDAHDGAPFRLNNFIAGNQFDKIIQALTLTNIDPPKYTDRFHHVCQLIDA
jgi:Transposase IS4